MAVSRRMKFIKKISLRPGMFVVQYGQGTEDHPYTLVGNPIEQPSDIARLIPDDVAEVMIDPDFDYEAWKREQATEADQQARAEAEQAAAEQREQEKEQRRQAEARARREAEERARSEAMARAKAMKARQEAEKKAVEQQAAEKKAADKAREKAEAEAKKRAREQARKQAALAAKKRAEEARKRAEEAAREKQLAEAREQAEKEAKRKAEERERRKRLAQAREQAEKAAREKAEAETRARAEEEARRKAVEKERHRAEQEARTRAEEKARRLAAQQAETKKKTKARPTDTPPVETVRQQAKRKAAASIKSELPKAERVYAAMLDHVRALMQAARTDTPLNLDHARTLVRKGLAVIDRASQVFNTLIKRRRAEEHLYTHTVNVALLSMGMGRVLDLSRNDLELLGLAALCHDLGLSRVPMALLNKPGKLTTREYDLVRTHPALAHTLLMDRPEPEPEIARIVLQHHERHGGNGYPAALSGGDIHPLARCLHVADVYDSMTSVRPWREAIPAPKALGMMYQVRADDFDPAVVQHFIRHMGIYPVGSLVRLTDGRCGVVAAVEPDAPLKPLVKAVFDADMQKIRARYVDIFEPGPDDAGVEVAAALDPQRYRIDTARLLG